ncbi:type I polyketide synthase [Saccharopolyspora erythraea]|uniref:type I polyketide synthase n=1 Tax=Saccharopolyspora erythraea TaxID=1836 RepID=UPI0020121725|nr:type I polyketide synthase [Saccharopolyspora erythraea]
MQEDQQEKVVDYLRRMTVDLRHARRRIDELEGRAREPIAVVGMACRYPGGVRTPEDLWELVAGGGDAISGPPANRGWDLARLARDSATTSGGFLHDADEFDADFFGISPREARAMDPQQRVLLEVCWEAVENAGIAPDSLRGTRGGVFVGAYHWGRSQAVADELQGYTMTGTASSVMSGRLAYALGLQGPALTVDTACSSSLVALHLAARSLREDESSLALAGGVTVMSDPSLFVEFSRQGGLAANGRCKAFSDDADGTGWAEGAGVVVLERLSDARRKGHRVLAVLRGSAVNSDGASNGLTAPNGPAQQRVIEQALRAAGLRPSDVDAIEAHGTGTRLGDPIEAQALLAAYGQGRERPLWLGSLKSNVGHTQAAAGVGGVIKVVQALRHGALPRTLHAERPSSHVDWESGAVRLLTEQVEWPRGERPRRAAVSSFGVSGTNAHAVLEEAPVEQTEEHTGAEEPDRTGPVVSWMVSAHSEGALREQEERLLHHVQRNPELRARDVGHSLVSARSVFAHRAVVLGRGRDELVTALGSAAGGAPGADVVEGTADVDGGTVLVFPGQGSQWAGMGADLLTSSDVFAHRIAECEQALRPHVDWSLTDVLREADGAPSLERVDVVQPATFAVMVSLAELWRSHGLRPDAVVGHSQGEIAAAVVSGALSLADGAKVVARRSQAIARRLAGAGGMLSIPLPLAEVEPLVAPRGISVASVNGPRSVAVSGDPEALDELFGELARDGVRVRRIQVDYASHSAHVETLREELLAELAGVEPQAARIPLLSTTTGRWSEPGELDAAYWYRNLRETVLFAPAIEALLDEQHRAFIEVSPHPVLLGGMQELIEHHAEPAVAVGTLRRDDGGMDRFLTSVASAFVRGAAVDWKHGLGRGRAVELPSYPFQRARFWTAPAPGEAEDAGFWQAVRRGDAESLATDLHVDQQALEAVLPALSSWHDQRRGIAESDAWRYEVRWKPLAGLRSAPLAGDWLLVTTAEAADDDVLEALKGQGADVRRLVLDESCVDRDVLAARLTDTDGLSGIVSTLAFAERPGERYPAMPLGLALTVSLVQALGDAGVQAPVWALTREAVRCRPDESLPNPVQSQVMGVAWTAALEHPQRWGGSVDLPAALDGRPAGLLAAALTQRDGEDQLAVRSAGVFARRLVRAAPPRPVRDWAPRDTVLVTGGTGAIAPDLARWLAGQGAQRIVLTSRRGLAAEGMPELVAELAEHGAAVAVEPCDVTDRDAVAAMLDRLRAEGHVIRTVVHAAAVIGLHTLDKTTLEDFAETVHAKVAGARHLDELLDEEELDAFVLYSSIAGMWGSGSHAAYAAGNAYLAALAENRRARGRPALSLHWGKWPDSPELAEADRHGVRRTGLRILDQDTAYSGLKRALDEDASVLALTDIDWDTYHPVFTSGRPTTLFDDVPEVRQAGRTAAATGTQGFADRLLALSETERARTLLELVRGEAAAVLGHADGAGLAERRTFREIGFDSVTAVELRNRLVRATGTTLPTTVVFDHPSPSALAVHLGSQLSGEREAHAATAVAASDEPIAIVGIGCRFPGGADSPEKLWRLVSEGADVISEFPADRGWDTAGLYDPDPDRAGTTYSVRGGFLDDASGFDAAFFGISPREARAMDPQQRLLLETAWEAIERAGIVPETLRGSATGTFVGASHQGYSAGAFGVADGTEGQFITGAAASVLSGRISYLLGLEGPAVTVDTACSSSLVALHLACQSLRSGESGLALAAGSTVIAGPQDFLGFSRLGALSADGRCKAFAEGADGMSLAEGVGVVVLERLSDATRNGHPVLAVVRGSATNQDGASNGLTAPNGPAQQRVIRQALANAGVEPGEVDVVEAHGTGTALGDPIEAQALAATYGEDRDPLRPLWLGSLKTNIGHAQASAGIAGVIKMVLALRNGVLPPTLHAERPTQHVDWSDGRMRLLTEAVEWPWHGRPRRAGVSAFGISGTNAHVILEQADAEEAVDGEPVAPVHEVVPLVLSARSGTALREQAARLLPLVEAEPADLAWSLLTTRSSFEHRAVVVGADRAELTAGLEALSSSGSSTNVVQGTDVGGAGPVFVFPGQGAQWWGMGRDLLASSEVFAARIDDCERALAPFVDWSLRAVLSGSADPDLVERVDVVQPALFSMMVALAEVWRAHGTEPAAVIGHSQGEIAAAHVAGALSLDDAARVVALRSKALLALAGQGGMVSVAASEDAVADLIGAWDGRISVAVVNGPSSVVVSGEPEALAEMIAECGHKGVRAREVAVDYASHGPHVERVRDELAEVLSAISPRPAGIPFYSTVTGGRIDTTELTADYWYANLRRTVRMEQATRALLADGHRVFIECSAHPVLASSVEETIDAACPDPAVVLGTLRRDEGGPRRLLLSLAEAYSHGVAVDWTALFTGEPARTVELPTYPFEHQRYWLTPRRRTGDEPDSAFWELVENGRPEALAEELGIDGAVLGTVLPALSQWRERRRHHAVVDSLRYRVGWTRLAEPQPAATGMRLVVVPESLDRWVSAVVDGLGEDVVVLPAGSEQRAELAYRLAEVAAEHEITGVVSLLSEVEPSAPGEVPAQLSATLRLVQALLDAGLDVPLRAVTRRAVAIGDEDVDPEQAGVWGLGRVVALEHPEMWGGLVDLPDVVDERVVGGLRAVLSGDEDQVAVRESGLFGRRLVHAPPARPEEFRARGTVLVTGGTGGVGGFVARWAVERGAEHVVLTSRRGPRAPGADELASELEMLGAKVTVAACDAGDREQLSGVLGGIDDLTSVFHVAGVAEGDDAVRELTDDQLAALLRSKRDAALHLHELTRDRELDAFVLFSSGAAAWGSGGQPGYAAANAFLDGLAEHRRASGLPATSIAWGTWGEAGMATEAAVGARLRRHGVVAMRPEQALDAMGKAIVDGVATAVVTSMDWVRFAPGFTSVRPSPLLSELAEVREALRAAEAEPAGAAGSGLRERLAGLPAAERSRALLDLVRAEAAATLGYDGAEAIPASRAFKDVGFDSVTAVELRNRLRAATGLPLPAALVFDHPTPSSLANLLAAELFGDAAADEGPEDPDARIREVLATIPLSRLRQAGLLDMVLRLAEDGGQEPEAAGVPADSIDDMDAESLLRLATGTGD